MSIDAGTIYSEVRIRLDKLNADIKSAGTAFDNLGEEFKRSAETYATAAWAEYKKNLESISKETENVAKVAKLGAISQEQSIERLISLRRSELSILQDRAVKEGIASKDTVAAIQKAQAAVSALESQQKLLRDGVEKTGSSFMDSFHNLQAVMQGPVAAVTQVIGLIKRAAAVVGELEDAWAAQAEAAAKLNSIFVSTGASAWTTMDHILGLSDALAKTTTYEDDTIQSMQGILLGFKKIQGVNFDSAVAAVLDMATVMKMDLTSAAQAVGKALDDPVSGMDSLTRQGFKFTDAEKALNKELVATGKIEEAQAIILKELATAYGGTSEAVAETATGLRTNMKKSVGELNEEMGRAISESGFMMAYRRAVKEISDEWARGLKEFNDYKAALAKEKSGATLTNNEELTIAEGNLRNIVLLQTRYINEWGGLKKTTPFDAEVQAQNDLIARIKGKILAEQRYAASTGENNKNLAKAAALQAEKDKIAAEWQVAVTKKRREIVQSYSDAVAESARQVKAGMMTEAEASAANLSARKKEIDSLVDLINSEDLKTGATTAILEEETKAYVEESSKQKAITDDLSAYEIEKAGEVEAARYQAAYSAWQREKDLAEQKKTEDSNLADYAIEKQGEVEAARYNAAFDAWQREKQLIEQRKAEEQNLSEYQIEKAGEVEAARYQAAYDSWLIESKNQELMLELYKDTDEYKEKAHDALVSLVKEQIRLATATGKSTESIAQMKAALDELEKTAKVSFSQYANTALQAFSDLFSALEQFSQASADAATSAIDAQLEALKASYGASTSELQTMYDALMKMGDRAAAADIKNQLKKAKAIDDYSSLTMEQLNTLYATAIAHGKTETASYIDAARKRLAADKDAADKKKKIEYDAAMFSWELKKYNAIASAAQAIMAVWEKWAGQPIIAGILTGVTALATGLQLAAIEKAKPTMATGGIVMPSGNAGRSIDVADKGGGEILFGTGSLGAPLMQGFADLVASTVAAQANQPITLRIELDGKVLAESTVRRINNGQVRMTR